MTSDDVPCPCGHPMEAHWNEVGCVIMTHDENGGDVPCPCRVPLDAFYAGDEDEADDR